MRNTGTLGARLKTERSRLRLTQAALAAKLDVQAWTVNRWECGHQMPDGERLVALALVLGVSVESLVAASCEGEPSKGGKKLPAGRGRRAHQKSMTGGASSRVVSR
jgi:transcriptional regulator with XRE-family HTH domain